MNLIISEGFTLSELTPSEDTIDLQAIESIDAFGVVTLLCFVQNQSTARPQRILPGSPKIQQHLSNTGFFLEASRRCGGQVAWDTGSVPALNPAIGNEVFTSVRYGGHGDERRIADDFRAFFVNHGYSQDLLDSGGCIIGDAGDNSHDHAHCPGYFFCTGTSAPRVLRIGIADLGDGILDAFRGNPDHASLDDERAMLSSLLAKKSGRQEPGRGNGMTEILKWTMSFKGTLRIDSGGRSLRIECGSAIPTYHSFTCDDLRGTRIGVILEDRALIRVSRTDASTVVEQFLRDL